MSITDINNANDSEENKPKSLADVTRQARDHDFRGRENEFDEENDLPSVNRRKGDNKLVTILGFVFILGAAAALIVAVNKDDKQPQKKESKGQVTNNLPPLIMPAQPAPLPVRPVVQPQQPSIKTVGPNGKPPLDWTERKMMGTLLIPTQNNTGAAATPAVSPQPAKAANWSEYGNSQETIRTSDHSLRSANLSISLNDSNVH